MSSFVHLAAALEETIRIEGIVLARLADSLGAEELERLARARGRLAQAAQLLTELAPHERLVRELARVGALVDCPAFTAQIGRLEKGSVVLMRATVSDPWAGDLVEVQIDGGRTTVRAPVKRADLLGLEKR